MLFCLPLSISLENIKTKGTLHFPWDVNSSSENKLNAIHDFSL